MKNILIVFLTVCVIYLLLGKKKAKELAQKAQDDIQGFKEVIRQDVDINGPGGVNAVDVGPELLHITEVYKPGEESTGRSPIIDRPLIMTPGPQIKVYENAFSNFTTGSRLGIFRHHERK